MQRLRQTGELSARLDQARTFGNHLVEPALLDRALSKARREALLQLGLPAGNALSAPPPAWGLMPTKGNVKVFALLIDFSDYPAYNSSSEINSALFGNGSLLPNAAPYESLASYYSRSSYAQLSLASGMTLGWYRPSYTRASMAMTTTARENLVKEALTSLDASTDFAPFDNDGNGEIEYFIVIWTGPDNGWANFWWGYATSFGDGTFLVDGKTLGKYSWQWEYRGGSGYTGPFSPKTVIHETGHGLGLPDYYDYNSSVGPDGGVGGLDMMDGVWGDHNSFSKWVLDWITPYVVASGSQAWMLDPSGTSQDAVLIMPGATSGDPFSELFLAQNRYRAGNDSGTGYPTDGMLIWHVDATLNAAGTDYQYNNSFTSHKLLKLMQSDGGGRIENQSATADAAMYYTPGDVIGPLSVPSSRDYAGVDTRVNVTGISQSWPQMTATFSIDDPSTMATLTVVKAGAGSGTVSSDSAGILCGTDCAESYDPASGTSVILTAVAVPGASFYGWTGGGCSGTGSCTVAMSANATVTATFGTTFFLDEDFDPVLTSLPSGWSRQITQGSGWWWFQYADWNTTGGNGGCALGATYSPQVSPYDIELRTPAIDLSEHAYVGLEFKTSISSYYSESTADVDVSTNGAAGPWTNVWRTAGVFTPGPQTVNVDLTSAAGGQADVMLRFRIQCADPFSWAVDDVKVFGAASPTLVDLIAFGAAPKGDSVELTWETASEPDNAGFHLWRATEPGDGYVRITTALIPGAGGVTQGEIYRFEDRDVVPGTTYFYRLEDIDTSNVSTFHGPTAVVMGSITLMAPAKGARVLAKAPPTFVWGSEPYDRFKVQFSRSADFLKRVVSLPTSVRTVQTWFTPSRATWRRVKRLSRRDGRLFWRVYGADAAGNSLTSDANSLWVRD